MYINDIPRDKIALVTNNEVTIIVASQSLTCNWKFVKFAQEGLYLFQYVRITDVVTNCILNFMIKLKSKKKKKKKKIGQLYL